MVEMAETANILHHATSRSLLILDEIGRGTSTFDGLALAQSIIEYIHTSTRCSARTLFATHYHELVRLAEIFPRIRCMNVEVIEEHGHIIFLRKIVPGGADKSYGIHVAQLAGIPKSIIHRAQDILLELETQQLYTHAYQPSHGTPASTLSSSAIESADTQVTDAGADTSPVLAELANIQIEQLTPVEAMSKLYELQKLATRS
jgi:DNA mismatch repair protein MutS